MKRTRESSSRIALASRAAAPEPEPASPQPRAGGTLITLHLVGRICLFSHEGRHAALFLDTRRNPALNFPEHHPLLRATMDDCTKEGAKLAKLTLADDRGRVQAVWDLRGFDLHFSGLMSDAEPLAEIDRIANLKAAFQPINAGAQWRGAELFEPDPRPYGVVARLWLKGFDSIDSMFFDDDGNLRSASEQSGPQTRTFLPGGFQQEGHAVIRCVGSFRSLAGGKPTLAMTPFGEAPRQEVPFDDSVAFQVTFSNLCNCTGTDPQDAKRQDIKGTPHVVEDEEFAIYYELLVQPPTPTDRPVPFVPQAGAGGGGVVQCVPTAQLS